jgi:hypothetical protein
MSGSVDQINGTTGGYAFGSSEYMTTGGNMAYEWWTPGGSMFALLDAAFLLVLLVTIYCLYSNVTPSGLLQGIGLAVAVMYVVSEVMVAVKGKEWVMETVRPFMPTRLMQ